MKRSHIIIMIVSFMAAVAVLAGSLFALRSCSTAPEYSSVEARLRELVEKSQEIDEIIFGKGLPAYERIYSPTARSERYETGENYTAANGKEFPLVYLYYKADENLSVYAFRKTAELDFSYAYVADAELDEAGIQKLKSDFPAPAAASEESSSEVAAENSESTEKAPAFYEKLSAYGGKFAYLVPYSEPECEFFYEATDDKDYDYVRKDAKLQTIEEIRKQAAAVYSPEYMASMENSLFGEYVELGDGERELVTKGRFFEDTRIGEKYLLQSNKKEDVLFTEKCVYDFSAAKVVKEGSNSTRVKISISYSFPSETDKKYDAVLQLVLVNDVWYLSSPTFAVNE